MGDNTRLKWTEGEIKLLKEVWANEKLSFDDISKIFISRTKRAIENKRYELGLPSSGERIKPKIDYDLLKKLTEVVEG